MGCCYSSSTTKTIKDAIKYKNDLEYLGKEKDKIKKITSDDCILISGTNSSPDWYIILGKILYLEIINDHNISKNSIKPELLNSYQNDLVVGAVICCAEMFVNVSAYNVAQLLANFIFCEEFRSPEVHLEDYSRTELETIYLLAKCGKNPEKIEQYRADAMLYAIQLAGVD